MAVFNRPKNKAILPAEVRFNPDLNDGEIRAYGEIVALCGKKTYCWPKNEYLENLLNKCTRTVTRALKKLTDLNLIEIKNNPEMWNRREIHLMPLPETPEAPQVDIKVQGGRHLCSQKADSLLIVKINDRINDRIESNLPSQKFINGDEFLKGIGLSPAKEDVRIQMGKVPSELTNGFDLDIEARRFFLHYSSNGWRIGNSKMVCFTSAIEKWFLTAQNFNSKKNVTNQKYTNRSKSFGHLEVTSYTGQNF